MAAVVQRVCVGMPIFVQSYITLPKVIGTYRYHSAVRFQPNRVVPPCRYCYNIRPRRNITLLIRVRSCGHHSTICFQSDGMVIGSGKSIGKHTKQRLVSFFGILVITK